MGTERRERQKQQHRQQQQSTREALKHEQRRRSLIAGVAAVAVLAVIGVTGWALFGGNDDVGKPDPEDATPATPPETSGPEASDPNEAAQAVSEAPCPPDGGTDERITAFDGPPQECIDSTKAYTAKIATSEGDFTVELDAENAPITVNNFVVLARSHFYDGIPFHRVVPDFVIQAGDPTDTDDLTAMGSGGPGYTIAEEPPADGVYETYDLAMAKTPEPNSTGSQFFVVTGNPAPLNATPTYSLFGSVTDGKEVVDALGNAKVGGPSGDTPDEAVTIDSVTITES